MRTVLSLLCTSSYGERPLGQSSMQRLEEADCCIEIYHNQRPGVLEAGLLHSAAESSFKGIKRPKESGVAHRELQAQPPLHKWTVVNILLMRKKAAGRLASQPGAGFFEEHVPRAKNDWERFLPG